MPTSPAATLAALALPAALGAQPLCAAGDAAPDFGWRSTECGNCSVYGAYLEYLTPPRIRNVEPRGPAGGRLRDGDVLLAVDGAAITTPAAWHLLRDARAGQRVRFTVARGGDTVETAVDAGVRCVPAPAAPRVLLALPPRLFVPGGRGRRFDVGAAVVDVDGRPDAVVLDPRGGELVVVAGGVRVTVRPRP